MRKQEEMMKFGRNMEDLIERIWVCWGRREEMNKNKR